MFGPVCGCADSCKLLRVEFQRGRSPLTDGATTHLGCVVSDELISALCESAEPAAGGKGGGRGCLVGGPTLSPTPSDS